MAKKKKKFCPFIYSDWGELFEAISVEQRAELLLAITKFPEYEPKDVPIWNFIKSQLNKDYQNFVEKCEKNSEISQSYWEQMKSNESERIPNESERIPNDIERLPKLKPLTKTKTKTKKENKEKEKEILKNFNEFYLMYPVKKSREKALSAYKKAILAAEPTAIMDGLKRYIDDIRIKGTEPRFIKHPSTWLNQGCWNDEYDSYIDYSNPSFHNSRL